MPRYLRLALITLAVLIVCLPIAIIVTFLLSPLWSWIEATYGIESIGHSGPSDWCFELVYGLLITIAFSVFAYIRVHLRLGKAKTM
jgi:phosphotransferase system  glucose/maltose/N-acetylglucosamine-specific IIC component